MSSAQACCIVLCCCSCVILTGLRTQKDTCQLCHLEWLKNPARYMQLHFTACQGFPDHLLERMHTCKTPLQSVAADLYLMHTGSTDRDMYSARLFLVQSMNHQRNAMLRIPGWCDADSVQHRLALETEASTQPHSILCNIQIFDTNAIMAVSHCCAAKYARQSICCHEQHVQQKIHSRYKS